ncbi:MAG: transposase [Nevskiaceae bacterium]|nr:MAG: transposase [Nevskiaceae bacterium]TBR71865.1 MAG: transposase [Nevskiaceae bacterium]
MARSTAYYPPRPVPADDLALMRRIDALHLEYPFAGSRMLRGLLRSAGHPAGRRHVRTLMRRMGPARLVPQAPHDGARRGPSGLPLPVA